VDNARSAAAAGPGLRRWPPRARPGAPLPSRWQSAGLTWQAVTG